MKRFLLLFLLTVTVVTGQEPSNETKSETTSETTTGPANESAGGQFEQSEEYEEAPEIWRFSVRQTVTGRNDLDGDLDPKRNIAWTYGALFRAGGDYSTGNFKFTGDYDLALTFYNQYETNGPLLERSIRNRPLNVLGFAGPPASQIVTGELYRLQSAWQNEKHRLSIGRQAISWGEGRFLNPLNLVTPIDPFSLDFNRIAGADSVHYSYYLNDLDSIEVVWVPLFRTTNSRTPFDADNNETEFDIGDGNVLGRYKFNLATLDTSILGGRHYSSYIGGLEFNLAQWGAGFRLSGLGRLEEKQTVSVSPFLPDIEQEEQVVWQIVAGASYALFDGRLRSTGEVFISGAVQEDLPAYSALAGLEQGVVAETTGPLGEDKSYFYTQGRIIPKNPVLVQLSFGYEINIVWNIETFFMYDPSHHSLYAGPIFNAGLSDELTWVTGLQVFISTSEPDAEFYGLGSGVFSILTYYF